MLFAAGGYTPIGINKLSRPNHKKFWRHLRSIAKRLFDSFGPFLNTSVPSVPYPWVYSGVSDTNTSQVTPSECYQRPPPEIAPKPSTLHKPNRFTLFLITFLSILLSFFAQPTFARLPDKNAFYTQELGVERIDTLIDYNKNVKIILSGSTHFYSIKIDKIKILQSFDYTLGKENKIKLFDENTNLEFVAYLTIGKDTVLKLVSDPKCRVCAIDTLKIDGKKITIKNKNGEILEENVQSLLSVKKVNNNLYKVEFGLEKNYYTIEDSYHLLNFVLTYGEIYERHLNAVVGEFKNKKMDILAYKGKNQGNNPIYEPTTVVDYLHLNIITAPSLYNVKDIETGYGYNFAMEGSKSFCWVAVRYYLIGTTMAMVYIGPVKEVIIRTGEQYNYLEKIEIIDSNDPNRKMAEDMLYSKFSKNSYNYDTTKWLMCKYSCYDFPGLQLRAPPMFFFFGKLVRCSNVREIDYWMIEESPFNSFYFYQYRNDVIDKSQYPPKGYPMTHPNPPPSKLPPADSIDSYMRMREHVFLFNATRGNDRVYEWVEPAKVKIIDGYYVTKEEKVLFAWTKIDTLKIPLDSIQAYLIPESKFIISFPSKKQIIILDDNPLYKKIARDGFVKFNNLYLPRDSIPAKVTAKIPSDGETSVSIKTFITIQFNEPIEFIKFQVLEDGKIKEGSWILTNDDSTLVWWPKDLFNSNSKITYSGEVKDKDSNKTAFEGYFYTENPASVNEQRRFDEEYRTIIVYDLLGRRIAEIQNWNGAELENLPNGTYIVTIDGKPKKVIIKTP